MKVSMRQIADHGTFQVTMIQQSTQLNITFQQRVPTVDNGISHATRHRSFGRNMVKWILSISEFLYAGLGYKMSAG